MAKNRSRSVVGYRKLRLNNTMQEGLLAVARPGGELEQKVASAMFRLAAHYGRVADDQAAAAGNQLGDAAGRDGAPEPMGVDLVPETGAAWNFDEVEAETLDEQLSPRASALRDGIIETANEIGIAPEVLATAISYETAGTFDPAKKGPTTQWGQHRGLIQFGEPQAREHGVDWNNPIGSQLGANGAIVSYLRQAGVKPGMGLLDVYSAINAGYVGRHNASDANNGGAPGTVRDKVEKQMRGHAAKAKALLSGAPLGGPTAVSASPLADRAPQVVVSGGKLGSFKPTGRNTVFGRAYDAAGTKSYLQMVDVSMRANMSAVYERHKDDPAKLRSAYDALLKVELDPESGQVFPEIETEYRTQFAKLRLGFEAESRQRMQQQREDADKAAFIVRTNDLNTEVTRQVQALGRDNPMADTVLADALTSLNDHYDSAVARGIMDQTAAVDAKLRARRQTVGEFYLKQAADLSADDIAAMRQELSADVAAGDETALDAVGWHTLEGKLQQLERSRRVEDKRAQSAYEKRAERLLQRAAAGFGVPDDEMSQFVQDASTAPDGETVRNMTVQAFELASDVADETLIETDARVRRMRNGLGSKPSETDIAALTFVSGLAERKRAQLTSDPQSYGERNGLFDAVPGLGAVETPDDLQNMVEARLLNAEAMADRYGAPLKVFKPGEADALRELIKSDPVAGAALAGALVEGGGGRATRVLGELGDDAPEIAQSGAIIAFGGSALAARDVLAGYATRDGKRLATIKRADRLAIDRAVIGDTLALFPKERERVSGAADAIARARMDAQGVDPADLDAAAPIYERALHEALGAQFINGVQYGGFVELDNDGFFGGFFGEPIRATVPSVVRADMLPDLIEAISDDDLIALGAVAEDGTPYTTRDVQAARPVTLNGGIAFALGDPYGPNPQFLSHVDGGILTVDLSAMRTMLEPRVPGAYR